MIFDAVIDQLIVGGHVHFFQDMSPVRADGFHAEVQFLADLGHGLSGGDHDHDLILSRRKGMVQWTLGLDHIQCDFLCQVGADHNFAFDNSADCVKKLVRWAGFAQIGLGACP